MAYDKGNGTGRGDTRRGGYQKRSYGDKPANGSYQKRTYGDKPVNGEGGYQKRSYGDKPEGGYQKRTYGDKPEGGYQKRTYGDKPEGSYQKRSYGDKPEGGYQKRTYGDKPEGSYQKRTYGDKPEGGYQKRSYGDKPEGGYQKRTYGDKPEGGYQKRSYGDKPEGGYQKRTYGDKPEGGYQKRTYGDKPEGGYQKRTYGDKPANGYQKRKYGERSRTFDDRRPPYTRAEEPINENEQNEADEPPFLIIGRNAVREAIKSGRSIDRIFVSPEPDGSLREILTLARDAGVLTREMERKKLDELCMPFGHGGKTANHQGIVACAAGVEYCQVSDILAVAEERGEKPFVIVIDGVTDPHNLGSIIRSAECAGVHGVVIGKRRCASVTAATVKASAGATEHVKIARVTNIGAAVDELKRNGVWIAGADMTGRPMDKQDMTGALAFVIGAEGEGLSKLVREKCDYLVSIPLHGKIDSLNASVAAGILLFEKRRQDGAAQ